MKTYKDFEKQYIGDSDIASLILVGYKEDELATEILKFGEDNSYYAYRVFGANVNIGSHYHKVAEFKKWMRVYDDCELVKEYHADKIIVYRAGEMGCIIQTINNYD